MKMSDTKMSIAQLAILMYIRELGDKAYGSAIARWLVAKLGGPGAYSEGAAVTVYSSLKRLVERGLVSAEPESNRAFQARRRDQRYNGARRVYYRLTDSGLDVVSTVDDAFTSLANEVAE
jgi:DNA-binding PadR family transcriptional regulator